MAAHLPAIRALKRWRLPATDISNPKLRIHAQAGKIGGNVDGGERCD